MRKLGRPAAEAMAPWMGKAYVVCACDGDGLPVDEGIRHLGPGGGKEPLHRAPGDAHPDPGLLLGQAQKVAQSEGFKLIQPQHYLV